MYLGYGLYQHIEIFLILKEKKKGGPVHFVWNVVSFMGFGDISCLKTRVRNGS